MSNRTIALATGAVVTALLLAGCSQVGGNSNMPGMDHGTGTMTTPSVGIGAEANQSDRMFVTMMIPHHQQAIEMADTLLAKGGIDPRVTDLAQQIKAAQGPEIELMEGWLEAWDVPMDAMGGMGDGMMSGDDMAALDAAAGEEATRLFLEQMVHHHQGAIEMAEAEIEGGKAPEVLALAQAVIEAQSTEIATMQQLLGTM